MPPADGATHMPAHANVAGWAGLYAMPNMTYAPTPPAPPPSESVQSAVKPACSSQVKQTHQVAGSSSTTGQPGPAIHADKPNIEGVVQHPLAAAATADADGLATADPALLAATSLPPQLTGRLAGFDTGITHHVMVSLCCGLKHNYNSMLFQLQSPKPHGQYTGGLSHNSNTAWCAFDAWAHACSNEQCSAGSHHMES